MDQKKRDELDEKIVALIRVNPGIKLREIVAKVNNDATDPLSTQIIYREFDKSLQRCRGKNKIRFNAGGGWHALPT